MTSNNEYAGYMFLVRQHFDSEPKVDSFYELKIPSGLSFDQIKVMQGLNPQWMKGELKEDADTYSALLIRMRSNLDMFPKVCIIRTEFNLNAAILEDLIKMKYHEGNLTEFLNECAI